MVKYFMSRLIYFQEEPKVSENKAQSEISSHITLTRECNKWFIPHLDILTGVVFVLFL